MFIDPGLLFYFTHIETAYLPGGNSWRLLQVIDLWVQSESQYPDGYFKLYIVRIWIFQDRGQIFLS